MAYINEKGQEVLSDETRVIAVPFHNRELSVFDRVRMLLAQHFETVSSDAETEDDANDFETDDEFDETLIDTEAQLIDDYLSRPKPELAPEPAPDNAPEPAPDNATSAQE